MLVLYDTGFRRAPGGMEASLMLGRNGSSDEEILLEIRALRAEVTSLRAAAPPLPSP